MTAKKETKEKQKSSKHSAGQKVLPMKYGVKKKLAAKSKIKKELAVKSRAGKKLAMKSVTAEQKSIKSKRAPKKVAMKTKGFVKKNRSAARTVTKLAPDESQIRVTNAFLPAQIGGRSGGQSGDLQGLSAVEGADSESVEELLEEGNAFEAGVVMGVEDAGDADLEEVRTHQVPEDDVPGEYLDSD